MPANPGVVVTSLLIGLVSHRGSRFASSQGAEGLSTQLQRVLGRRGLDVTIRVVVENLFDARNRELTATEVHSSLRQTRRVQGEWRRFLRQGQQRSLASGLISDAADGLRMLRSEVMDVQPWRGSDAHRTAQARRIRRLLNIEMAHVSIMKEAIDSGLEWCLILEDDAETLALEDCVSGIHDLMMADAFAPSIVNLSESHTLDELGIAHNVKPAPLPWRGTIPRKILAGRLPVTNTVCAMLYQVEFLSSMILEWAGLPEIPTVPIDWKLNQVLMRMYASGKIPDYATWIVDPAPIVQQSIHGAIVRGRS